MKIWEILSKASEICIISVQTIYKFSSESEKYWHSNWIFLISHEKRLIEYHIYIGVYLYFYSISTTYLSCNSISMLQKNHGKKFISYCILHFYIWEKNRILQPHSWIVSHVVHKKVMFLGVFLNKTPFFSSQVHFLRDILNFWSKGCIQVDMIYKFFAL